jgi:hypothetical protein
MRDFMSAGEVYGGKEKTSVVYNSIGSEMKIMETS